MLRQVRGFGAFLHDLVIGDDWRVAVGTAAALALTFGVSRTATPSWWLLPVAAALLLSLSVIGAARHRRGSE